MLLFIISESGVKTLAKPIRVRVKEHLKMFTTGTSLSKCLHNMLSKCATHYYNNQLCTL